MSEQQKIDPVKAREIRRLMNSGDKAVAHRYGEAVKDSPEYRKAAAQRATTAGRERRREQLAAEQGSKTPEKQSARDRVLAAERRRQEQRERDGPSASSRGR